MPRLTRPAAAIVRETASAAATSRFALRLKPIETRSASTNQGTTSQKLTHSLLSRWRSSAARQSRSPWPSSILASVSSRADGGARLAAATPAGQPLDVRSTPRAFTARGGQWPFGGAEHRRRSDREPPLTEAECTDSASSADAGLLPFGSVPHLDTECGELVAERVGGVEAGGFDACRSPDCAWAQSPAAAAPDSHQASGWPQSRTLRDDALTGTRRPCGPRGNAQLPERQTSGSGAHAHRGTPVHVAVSTARA